MMTKPDNITEQGNVNRETIKRDIKTMRLRQNIKEQIIKYSMKHFGDKVQLYLFGSRVSSQKKGGVSFW